MKKLITFLTPIALFLVLATPALAQNANKLKGNECLYKGVVTIECVLPLFANIIYWLIIFSGTIAVFFVIFGGIKLLTSSGVPEKLESAKKTIMWSVIGLVVVLLSFMMVNVVADLTGVNCISRLGFTNCGGVGELKACSKQHPTGYCDFAGQTCIRENSQVYRCEWPCSQKHPKGYCSNGTCKAVTVGAGVVYLCQK